MSAKHPTKAGIDSRPNLELQGIPVEEFHRLRRIQELKDREELKRIKDGAKEHEMKCREAMKKSSVSETKTIESKQP